MGRFEIMKNSISRFITVYGDLMRFWRFVNNLKGREEIWNDKGRFGTNRNNFEDLKHFENISNDLKPFGTYSEDIV